MIIIREFYYCSTKKCRYFTKLMYLIITEKKYKNGHQKIIKHLRNKKNRSKINHQNEEGWTALMIAVTVIFDKSYSYQTIKLLLKNGADPNIITKNYQAALTLAIINSNHRYSYEVVKLLIDYGANINYVDEDGWTPLMFACKYSKNNTTIIELLLDKGADLDAQDGDGWTPLMYACRFCNKKAVELLLNKGADIDARDNDHYISLFMANPYLFKNTDLEYANINAYLKIMDILVIKKANINSRDKKGNILMRELYTDKYNGNCETIKFFLDNKININAQDNYGLTALMIICKCISREYIKDLLKLLLGNGANPNIKDKCGKTVLNYLFDRFKYDCRDEIKILLNYRIDINNFRINGNSLLLEISQKAPNNIKLDWLLMLLEHKANHCLTDKKSHTFLDYLEDDELIPCLEIIEVHNKIRLEMNSVIQEINEISEFIPYDTDNFRFKIFQLQWKLRCDPVVVLSDLTESESIIADYLCVTDIDHLREKINDMISNNY